MPNVIPIYLAAVNQTPAFGKRDQQNRVGHRDAERHDRAHERLQIQGRSRGEKHEPDAAQRGGYRRD